MTRFEPVLSSGGFVYIKIEAFKEDSLNISKDQYRLKKHSTESIKKILKLNFYMRADKSY